MPNLPLNISGRTIIKAAGVIGITFLAIYIVILILNIPQIPKDKSYFLDEPETWVEPQLLTDAEDSFVNVFKASGGESSFSGNRQTYYVGEGQEAFFLNGIYQGVPFTNSYFPDEYSYLNDSEIRKHLVVELSPYMNPGDGIIQGFIFARKNERGYDFHIFVDQDWVEQMDYTNILYGKDFNNPATLKKRAFRAREVGEGVYTDVVDDSSAWYDDDPIYGGIIVGQINDVDEGNATFMVVR